MGGDDPWVGKVVSIELGELYATQCKDLNISRFSYFFFFFFFFFLMTAKYPQEKRKRILLICDCVMNPVLQ